METTTLYLATGLTRVIKGRAEDIGNALKARTMSADDGFRRFTDLDGETITIAAQAVLMVEKAATEAAKATFGFARVLERDD